MLFVFLCPRGFWLANNTLSGGCYYSQETYLDFGRQEQQQQQECHSTTNKTTINRLQCQNHHVSYGRAIQGQWPLAESSCAITRILSEGSQPRKGTLLRDFLGDNGHHGTTHHNPNHHHSQTRADDPSAVLWDTLSIAINRAPEAMEPFADWSTKNERDHTPSGALCIVLSLLYSQFSAMHSSYRRNIISVGHHFSPRKQHRGTQKKSHDSSDWRGLACPATINERMNEATQPTTTWWPTTTWCDCFLVHDALIADWSFCCQHRLQAASSFLTSPRTSSKDMLGNLVLNLQSPSLRSTKERRTWRRLEYLRKHFQMDKNNFSPKTRLSDHLFVRTATGG